MVKTVQKAEPQAGLNPQQTGVESIEQSGLWSTEFLAAFQRLVQLQSELGANSFRDSMARLRPTFVLNSAVDKVLESVGYFPAQMEQAASPMRTCFDLLATAQVDWFSRACDNWFELSRSASANVFRSTAGEAVTDRRLSARLITFPDRRSAAAAAGSPGAIRHAG